MTPHHMLAALALTLTLGACAGKEPPPPPILVTTVTLAAPRLPIECTADNPNFPLLPRRDITADEAARDRMLIKRRYAQIAAWRMVCRASLKAQQPSTDLTATAR